MHALRWSCDCHMILMTVCLQVYIKHLDGEEGEEKRKLKVAKRGAEPWEFTRCFHGFVVETEA